ncbi:nuclear transport factor 2 family protein [Nocardia veterana]|uniref:Nuclear transport factor 2 family protein n=1 Tax=Nocardia veterana TaxID=132249 RepID=A0A7X6M068_9NOCA|nr:nuclear transport factor 2 family protein [Nocardia veterana]NKY87783.1 nuclear transport factor 2 family protein [Nocardia veterana]
MSDINDLIDRYLAVWNETDPAERAALIAETFADDAEYTDPLVSVHGHAGLDAAVAAVQQQFPGLSFTLGGAVDHHHDIARFTWNLGRPGEEPLVVGFDVAVVADDGRIDRIHGFLDRVPTGA